MTRIALLLAYRGTDFAGWQIQPDQRTAQGETEKALRKLHKGQPTPVVCSGRTDTGVHARGQVVHFDTTLNRLPPENFRLAINRFLPSDIRVLASRKVERDFHARHDAVLRVYRYYLKIASRPDPFAPLFALTLNYQPDLARLAALGREFIGGHDFSNFCRIKDKHQSRLRTIDSFTVYPEKNRIIFTVAGRSFLWRMVRLMVGAVLALERRAADAFCLRQALADPKRLNLAPPAPACGLFLEKVIYAKKLF